MAKYVTFPLNNTDYKAEDMQLWHSTRGSGVFSADGELETIFKSGMIVTVSPGRAWMGFDPLKGVIFGNMENADLTVDMADGLLDRKDYVVIKFDIINNETYLYVKKGEESNDPQPPILERNASTSYELAIAEINVTHGIVELSQGLIADKRLDESVCGIMKDGVTSIPTASLQAQWDVWFETTRDSLSDDVAGNLLSLINANDVEIEAIKEGTNEPEALPWSNNAESIKSMDTAGMVDGAIFSPEVKGIEPITDESGNFITTALSYDLVVLNPNNVFDGELEIGTISDADGANSTDLTRIRTKNYITVKSDQQYVISGFIDGTINYIFYYDINKEYISFVIGSSGNDYIFTTPTNAMYARISKQDSANLDVNIMITKGDTIPIAYVPYNPSKTEFSTVRRMTALNGVYDEIDKNGKLHYRISDDIVLDDSLNWLFSKEYIGFKRVYARIENSVDKTQYVTKDDGTVLYNYGIDILDWTQGDISDLLGNYIYVSIADSESGWAEDYTPTGQDIKDYFNIQNYKLVYQLAQEEIIENGVDDYQAPGDLIAELNGDFITIGKLRKIFTVTDTNVITLSDKEKLISIDADNCGIFAIQDGKYTKLDATLTDSQTITLTTPIAGTQQVQIKGQLDPSLYLTVKVNADVAINVAANREALNKGVTDNGVKIQQLQDTLDLAIVAGI